MDNDDNDEGDDDGGCTNTCDSVYHTTHIHIRTGTYRSVAVFARVLVALFAAFVAPAHPMAVRKVSLTSSGNEPDSGVAQRASAPGGAAQPTSSSSDAAQPTLSAAQSTLAAPVRNPSPAAMEAVRRVSAAICNSDTESENAGEDRQISEHTPLDTRAEDRPTVCGWLRQYRGEPYCFMCRKHATEEHLKSQNHLRRVAWYQHMWPQGYYPEWCKEQEAIPQASLQLSGYKS